MDFKEDIDNNTVIVRNFNTLLSTMDLSSRQKISKDIVALNETLDQMYLIDMYRTFHPKQEVHTCTFFSSTHGQTQRQTTC